MTTERHYKDVLNKDAENQSPPSLFAIFINPFNTRVRAAVACLNSLKSSKILQSVEASRVCVFKHWGQINISEFHETNYITESCDTTQIQPVLSSTTWSTSWWTDLRSACRFTAGSLTLDGDDLTRRRSFSCSTHQPKENTATLIWNRNKNKKVFLHLTWD